MRAVGQQGFSFLQHNEEDLVETSQEGRGVEWGGVGVGSFSHTFWHVINPSRGIRVAVFVCFVSGEFGRLVSMVVPVRAWMSVVLMPVPGFFPPQHVSRFAGMDRCCTSQ